MILPLKYLPSYYLLIGYSRLWGNDHSFTYCSNEGSPYKWTKSSGFNLKNQLYFYFFGFLNVLNPFSPSWISSAAETVLKLYFPYRFICSKGAGDIYSRFFYQFYILGVCRTFRVEVLYYWTYGSFPWSAFWNISFKTSINFLKDQILALIIESPCLKYEIVSREGLFLQIFFVSTFFSSPF